MRPYHALHPVQQSPRGTLATVAYSARERPRQLRSFPSGHAHHPLVAKASPSTDAPVVHAPLVQTSRRHTMKPKALMFCRSTAQRVASSLHSETRPTHCTVPQLPCQ
jgi:hypothetical protein